MSEVQQYVIRGEEFNVMVTESDNPKVRRCLVRETSSTSSTGGWLMSYSGAISYFMERFIECDLIESLNRLEEKYAQVSNSTASGSTDSH